MNELFLRNAEYCFIKIFVINFIFHLKELNVVNAEMHIFLKLRRNERLKMFTDVY